jgi:hypothetical protein
MAVAETLAPLIVSVIKWVTFQLTKTRIAGAHSRKRGG